jgi:hypothetical protein
MRTMPWFIRVLVGLFLAAQFSGVVSSPRASALPVALAAADAAGLHDHGQRAQACAHHSKPQDHHQQHHRGGGLADMCCDLHACCAGALPSLPAVGRDCADGEPMAVSADDLTLGPVGGRLDRPPRSVH